MPWEGFGQGLGRVKVLLRYGLEKSLHSVFYVRHLTAPFENSSEKGHNTRQFPAFGIDGTGNGTERSERENDRVQIRY